MNTKPIFTIHDKNPQHTAAVFKKEISSAITAQMAEKYYIDKKIRDISNCNLRENAI